eukprot:Pgem_evm1s17659
MINPTIYLTLFLLICKQYVLGVPIENLILNKYRRTKDYSNFTINGTLLNKTLYDHDTITNVINAGLNGSFEEDIINSGLDPLSIGQTEKATEKLKLGVCTAKAEAKVEISDLTGLSSLKLTDVYAYDIVVNNESSTGSSYLGFGYEVDNLKCSGKVKASAGCGLISISDSVGLDVKVSSFSILLDVAVVITTDEENMYIDFNKILDSWSMDMGIWGIEVGFTGSLQYGLDILLSPVTNLILDVLSNFITLAVQSPILKLLQKETLRVFPITIPLSNVTTD